MVWSNLHWWKDVTFGVFLVNRLRENLQPVLARAWELINDVEAFRAAETLLQKTAKLAAAIFSHQQAHRILNWSLLQRQLTEALLETWSRQASSDLTSKPVLSSQGSAKPTRANSSKHLLGAKNSAGDGAYSVSSLARYTDKKCLITQLLHHNWDNSSCSEEGGQEAGMQRWGRKDFPWSSDVSRAQEGSENTLLVLEWSVWRPWLGERVCHSMRVEGTVHSLYVLVYTCPASLRAWAQGSVSSAPYCLLKDSA